MRATLTLLFAVLGFQAFAETRAECAVAGVYLLKGSELTEQREIPETLYIQYDKETLSISDGKFPTIFKSVSSDETAGFIFSREFIHTENGALSAAVIMNPACDETMTASGTLRTIHFYGITYGTVITMSADCSCPN